MLVGCGGPSTSIRSNCFDPDSLFHPAALPLSLGAAVDSRAWPVTEFALKKQLQSLIAAALDKLEADEIPATDPIIERARDPRHGDFASNVAMKLAAIVGRPPRELAASIVAALPASELVSKVDIAGPGFINFTLSPAAYHREIESTLDQGNGYGRSDIGSGQRILTEFVSANPTGPLHVGHGRHAAYGASVSNVLEAAGYQVDREYYVNDSGRQMNILTVSVWLRYLELNGESLPFPRGGYRGQYVLEIAKQIEAKRGIKLTCKANELTRDLPADAPDGDADTYIDAMIERARETLGAGSFREIQNFALKVILEDIRSDLHEFRVDYDEWFSERSLQESGAVKSTIEKLTVAEKIYKKDGALWFRSTDYGDEKDRVVVKENGQATYFAADLAHHAIKHERGYDHLINVLGADHHGYVSRIRAGYEAMGGERDRFEIPLMQFVTLYRGGEKVKMSTRSGEFITLRELREDVGNDASRYFYVMRSNDQHLDFDTDLAKAHTKDNPVYYVQYMHARICSVFEKMTELGWTWDEKRGRENLDRLDQKLEISLMRSLSRYPEVIELAAANRAPHLLAHYLQELANDFHTCYQAHKILIEDEPLRHARLALATAARHVVGSGLSLLGVDAPESM